MIDDFIRRAHNEHEIYFLLTAYLEAVQFGDKKNFVSEATIALPLTTLADLDERFTQLFIDLDNASKALDDRACLSIKEALHVFGSAVHRLHYLAVPRRPRIHGTVTNRRHTTPFKSPEHTIKGNGVGFQAE